jgi:ArsR family transcriptional regulator, arsenate/arsenite/antimonite-responsive transcriptional repressor
MDSRQFQKISKALADPRRFELLQKIARCDELACSHARSEMPISAATLSHHIKELANAGLIDVRKEAKFLHMKLKRKVWKEYLAQLSRL